jgi:serine protease
MFNRLFFIFLLTLSFLAAREQRLEPGKAVIRIHKDTSIKALHSDLLALGITDIKPRFHTIKDEQGLLKDIYELDFAADISPYSLINALHQIRGIVYAEPIFIDDILESPDDLYYPSSLNFASMQAEAAWDIHKCEDGTEPTIIAIVDTGVAWKHPDLAENIWQNLAEDANGNGYTMYHNGTTWVMDSGDLNGIDDDSNGKIDDLIGWNFLLNAGGDQNNDPNDPGGHGTRVAGLAGARTNNEIGVASLSWNPILMPISCSRSGATSSIVRGYDAIIYAAENGANVINCSWGGTGYAQANKDAIDYATSLGAIVVAAAGNSNNSIPLYPAAYPKVVATAALNNDGSKWTGSNYGAYLDLGTPNQSVYSTTTTSYSSSSGATSYAAPIASALAALVRSYHPTFSSAEIVNQIKASCDNIDSQNPNHQYLLGEGKINAYRALSEVEPTVDPALKLELFGVNPPNDTNANLAIEPNESFSLNLMLRNYSEFSATADFVLSSDDPDLQILNSVHQTTIPQDEYFSLEDAFEVLVAETASSHYATLTLEVSSALPIHNGQSLSFEILIQCGGIFVWEAKAGARDQSGTFIRNQLSAEGRQVVYGNTFPASLYGFDAVFLSFGAIGSNIQRLNESWMYEAIRDYLFDGGKIYIEGADAIGFDLAYYLALEEGGAGAHTVLWPLLGIADASDGTTNAIDLLSAQLPFSELEFSSTNQTNLDYIDLFSPHLQYGYSALLEDGYGIVGIAGQGDYGQKSIVFSYALAELADAAEPNTRANLLRDIVVWFIEPPVLEIQSSLDELKLLWEPDPLARSYRVLHSPDPGAEFELLADELQDPLYVIDPIEQQGFFKLQAMP